MVCLLANAVQDGLILQDSDFAGIISCYVLLMAALRLLVVVSGMVSFIITSIFFIYWFSSDFFYIRKREFIYDFFVSIHFYRDFLYKTEVD